MSSVSQGKLVGSKGAMFRQTSTSKPDDWRDTSGKDLGASRNFAHEKAAVDKAAASKAKKEQDIINRTKAAAQRAKETLRMAKEEISEAKKFVYDKPQSHLVKLYDKKPTADLHGMHQRWSGDHQDKKSSPSRSEDLLAVHHVLKGRGQNPAELPQHKNLGMMRMHEETGTEARVKIRNVARPDDAEPTSEKSKLSKQAEIKTKIVEERPTMSKIDFGLPFSLINATRSIMEKKHAKEAKTEVDLDPETNDKMDDENGDNDVKKESKHTTPKSAKEKKLAALAHPKDKITHKDVLVGRGVLKKEETEIKEAIKPYVSYSGPRPGKSPSATVMAAGEKPHKTFSKDEHGADYKQKAMDYFKKNMKKLHSEEVEEIDELDKKTLGSYVTKVASLSPEKIKPSREAGIEKATKKYKMKEEVDIDSLTEEELEEVLKKSDPAGKWISDFVHSKDPKFEGKSKKERMKQALGAYYAKQRNEEVEEVEGVDESKWDYPKSMTRPRIDSYLGKTGQDERAARKAWRKKIKAKQHKELMTAKQRNEEVEQLDELEEGDDQFTTKRRLDMIAKQEKKLPPGLSPERKALAIRKQKAMKAHKAAQGMKEEEQLDELEKSTLASYTKKAVGDVAKRSDTLGKNLHLALDPNHMDTYGKYYKKTEKRKGMINKAVDKLAKEEVELTAEEIERIESIASQLDEAKPTIVSAPIRGANQDQSGFGVKKNTADYTISDEKKVRKEEADDDFAVASRSTTRGNVVKTKSGDYIATNHEGSTKTFSDKMKADKHASSGMKEEVELEEAIKIGSKVKVHAPGKDYHGVIGNVGEIDHGLHNKSEKRYTVDYNNRSKSVTVSKSQIKLHKEEVEKLDETVLHDRYIRSHGKKARGSGDWAFTTKSTGTPEKHEMAWTKGSLGDAAKEAKKKLNAKQVYVMENSIIEVELEEGRGRPRKSGEEAEGDDTHKHPIQQLTKISHAIEGSEPHFEHKDGAKTKVGKHLAKHVMAVYGSMRTSQEKDDFANKLHASKDSMKSAVSKLF